MELCYIHWICLLLAALIKGVLSECAYPGERDDATILTNTLKQNYDPGEIVVYVCTVEEGTLGHVVRTCNSDDTWTEASRTCSDSIVWEYGGLGGVLVAGVNYLIAISFMAYSRKYKTVDTEEEGDNKPKSTTSNGDV